MWSARITVQSSDEEKNERLWVLWPILEYLFHWHPLLILRRHRYQSCWFPCCRCCWRSDVTRVPAVARFPAVAGVRPVGYSWGSCCCSIHWSFLSCWWRNDNRIFCPLSSSRSSLIYISPSSSCHQPHSDITNHSTFCHCPAMLLQIAE